MPAFRVGKPRTAVQVDTTFTAGVNVLPVPWDSVRWSEGEAMWQAAAPTVITLTRPGLWLVTMAMDVQGAGANDVVAQLYDQDFNSLFITPLLGSIFGHLNTAVTLLWSPDAGLELTLYYLCFGSTTWQVSGGANHLEVARVGPERWTG